MKTRSLAARTKGTRRPQGLLIRDLARRALLLISDTGHDEGYVMIRASGPAGGVAAFIAFVIYLLLHYHVIK
jgi:hypothetical protein